MKNKVVAIILCFASITFAGGQEGGGGGEVHDSFIAVGKRVLYYLYADKEGKKLAKRYKLNLYRLKNTIRDKGVFVYDDSKEPLRDHRGSIVDAYAFPGPGRIHLALSIWKGYFESGRDIYRLVFKEMLRAEGNYFENPSLVSDNIKPFPEEHSLAVSTSQLKYWIKFEKEILNSTKTGLSKAEEKAQKEYGENPLSLFATDSPLCQTREFELNSGEILSAAIIRHVKRTGCTINPSPCNVVEESFEIDKLLHVYKTVYWRGHRIDGVPFYYKDLQTGDLFTAQTEIYEPLLNDTLAELESQSICQLTGRKQEKRIPRTSEVTGYAVPLVYLSKSPKECKGCGWTELPNSILGEGSIVELASHRAERGAFGALLIKVRVIENSVSDFSDRQTLKFKNGCPDFVTARPQKFPLSEPGEVGYITSSSTKFFNYVNFEIDQVLNRD